MIIAEVQKMHLVIQSQAKPSSSDGSLTLAKTSQQSSMSIPGRPKLDFTSIVSPSSQNHRFLNCTAEGKESRISKFRYGRTIYRLHVPIWFTSRLWEIQLRRSQGGWDNKIRTYNIIPQSSPIFHYCKDFDIEVYLIMTCSELGLGAILRMPPS